MKGNEVIVHPSHGGRCKRKAQAPSVFNGPTTSVRSIVERGAVSACTIMVEIMKLSSAGHERAFVRRADSWPTLFLRLYDSRSASQCIFLIACTFYFSMFTILLGRLLPFIVPSTYPIRPYSCISHLPNTSCFPKVFLQFI